MSVRLPKRFAKATVQSLDPKLFDMVCAFASNIRERVSGVRARRGILLCGPPGVGKSWALAALTREYVTLTPGRTDHEFVTSPEFIENLPPVGAKMDSYRGRTFIQSYQQVSWLVINDLGKENRQGKFSEQVPFQLGRVLRKRSEENLLTFITTNLNAKRIREVYGDSIASLISEMMDVYVVKGPDRRLEGVA